MGENKVITLRKLSQKYAYASLQMHETIAQKAGFSGTDHKYLGVFLQKGKLTAGELAELTGLTTGAVTGLIDRFEKKMVVKRELDSSDRRKVYIVPDVEKIARHIQPYYEAFQAETEKMMDSFTDEQVGTIQIFLEKSVELMQTTRMTILHDKITVGSKDSSIQTQVLDIGPFYHGTRADLQAGDLLTSGFRSNYKPEIIMNHIYFTALINGAGLAADLAQGNGAGRIYIVEPTGPFENDPNVTDKKFPGNPTRSYRSQAPLKIIGEVTDWSRLSPEEVQQWRDNIARNNGDIIN
jgi:DNA-binding MarR family transcriptional regulator